MGKHQIRIVSDGTALGTEVYDADAREIKGRLTEVEWRIKSGKVAEAGRRFPE